jgi:hypothetical protein
VVHPAVSVDVVGDTEVRLPVGEVTGAVGNSVTVLPVVVGVTSLGVSLFGFAVF